MSKEMSGKNGVELEGLKKGAPRVAASSYLNTVPLIWSFMYGTRMRDEFDSLKDVRTVALDTSSRTSVALVQIIFREFLGFEPEWMKRPPDVASMLKTADAALIIGDPGMS